MAAFYFALLFEFILMQTKQITNSFTFFTFCIESTRSICYTDSQERINEGRERFEEEV